MNNDMLMEIVRSAFDEAVTELNADQEARLRLTEDLLERSIEREAQTKRLVWALSGIALLQFVFLVVLWLFVF